jgi:hypothetical protein
MDFALVVMIAAAWVYATTSKRADMACPGPCREELAMTEAERAILLRTLFAPWVWGLGLIALLSAGAATGQDLTAAAGAAGTIRLTLV